MKHGRPQAKDIDDDTMLDAIRKAREISGISWAFFWDIAPSFPDLPEKVVRAKLAGLIRRGIVHGCTCGCRGDFEIDHDIEAGHNAARALIRSLC